MRALSLLLLLSACAPDLGAPASLVTRTRVVAVQSMPAEVHPGDTVMLQALQISPTGTTDGSGLSWSLCTAPKPLSDNDTVSTACLDEASALSAVGTGETVSSLVPDDACQLFGPDPPPEVPGQPPLTARAPDVTGGYYVPVRVDGGDEPAFDLQRIACDLADASPATAADYAMQYKPNQNPTIAMLTDVTSVPADTDVALRVDWSADSAETFPVLDLTTFQLVEQREAMRVSWFVTAGSLALDRSGRDADELETDAENTWHTPATAGPVPLWIVLRDSRGGVAWMSVTANVH